MTNGTPQVYFKRANGQKIGCRQNQILYIIIHLSTPRRLNDL